MRGSRTSRLSSLSLRPLLRGRVVCLANACTHPRTLIFRETRGEAAEADKLATRTPITRTSRRWARDEGVKGRKLGPVQPTTIVRDGTRTTLVSLVPDRNYRLIYKCNGETQLIAINAVRRVGRDKRYVFIYTRSLSRPDYEIKLSLFFVGANDFHRGVILDRRLIVIREDG